MIYVTLVALAPDGQKCLIGHQVKKLELALEIINTYVLLDHHLLSAHLHADGSSVALPVAAFDGRSMTAALQDLEKEWNQVL